MYRQEPGAQLAISLPRLALLFGCLFWVPFVSPVCAANLTRWSAGSVDFILRMSGYAPIQRGDLLALGSFRVRIIPECTSYFAQALWLSVLFACPGRVVAKWPMALAGGLLLEGFNSLRIAGLLVIGARMPQLFHGLHVYSGQILSVLIVIFLCLAAVRRLTYQPLGGLRPLALRTLVLTTVLFLLWVPLQRLYLWGGDALLGGLADWFGHPVHFAYGHFWYPQTFSLLIFVGLHLATLRDYQRGTQPDSYRSLLPGLALLAGIHLLIRSANVLASAFGYGWGYQLGSQLHIWGQYLMPLLLWLLWRQHGEKRTLDHAW